MSRIVSDELLDFVKRWEGFRSRPYVCPGGKWTIGYGWTHGVGPRTQPVSESAASVLLEDHLNSIARQIIVATNATLSAGQIDALTSFAYNVGFQALLNSTLWRKLNSGDVAGAANEFQRWVYATKTVDGKKQKVVLPGLVKRREGERTFFMKGTPWGSGESSAKV